MDSRADSPGRDVAGLLSVVVPVRDEAQNVQPLFEALARDVRSNAEFLLVFDTDDDPTVAQARLRAGELPGPLRLIKNDLGRGPANALRAGFNAARGDAVVVVMADLSDELTIVDAMLERLRAGCDLVVGSRYMRGGKQIGGPVLKRTLSRLAGASLFLWGLPTHDATNAFKMYRASLLRAIPIQGGGGFEISMEMTIKAWLAGANICEMPATWTDRVAGKSKFRLMKWLPKYLHWYFYALRGRLSRTKR
ncbi:MAG TPA: glycosyltransferase [Candidatus Baltobacteraceae bacterium]